MKTLTFSNDQAIAVRLALQDRIKALEEDLAAGRESMYCRDQLDIARQALAMVEDVMMS